MRVIVFDIDGTLTETKDVDELHFARAIQSVLSIELASFDAFPGIGEYAEDLPPGCKHVVASPGGRPDRLTDHVHAEVPAPHRGAVVNPREGLLRSGIRPLQATPRHVEVAVAEHPATLSVFDLRKLPPM